MLTNTPYRNGWLNFQKLVRAPQGSSRNSFNLLVGCAAAGKRKINNKAAVWLSCAISIYSQQPVRARAMTETTANAVHWDVRYLKTARQSTHATKLQKDNALCTQQEKSTCVCARTEYTKMCWSEFRCPPLSSGPYLWGHLAQCSQCGH